MKQKLNITALTFLVALLASAAAGLFNEAASGQVNVKYDYDDNFEHGVIAKAATADDHGKVIARAQAIRKITTTMPFQIEVRETQYDESGKVVYEGTLVISLRQYGGVVKETPISGNKRYQIFDSWGTAP